MLGRLWWKEARAFGPIWLILGLAAAGLQWSLLSVRSEDVRSGVLTSAALVWAIFYAFAVGSAAFAGERESRTMAFLDALPVGRGTLWLGKASFALASTLGLALLLAGLAAAGTEARDPARGYGYGLIVPMFGTLLFEAVAWGFLWSSLSKNPLLAGAMSVVSVAVVSIYAPALIPSRSLASSANLVAPEAVPARLLVASVVLAASALAVCWRPRAIVRSWSMPRVSIDFGDRYEIAVRRASAARSLDWQARREGWTTGLLVVILGLVIPILAWLQGWSRDGSFGLFLAVVAALVAGVATFGAGGVSATPRFLVHHGVAPGTVWARRAWIWGLGMSAFLAVFLLVFGRHGPIYQPRGSSGPSRRVDEIAVTAAIVIDAFALGLVCGMAITRRITAVLVGVLAFLAIVPVQVGLAMMEMVPGWSLLITPAILIGVSRAWAGDWMMGREGARPWVRLGLLLLVPFALLASTYVAWRALGEPDVGPQFGPEEARVAAIPPGQDAVEEYRRAIAKLEPGLGVNPGDQDFYPDVEGVILHGWDRLRGNAVTSWGRNQTAIELTRKASRMPASRFEDVERLSIDLPQGQVVQGVRVLAMFLGLDTRERLSRADLPGAWEDILAQFRMANQLMSTTPALTQTRIACGIHHRAVGLAIDWAGEPKLTAAMVRSARDDLKRLAPLPSVASTLRVESLIVDRTLDLSAEDLDRYLGSGSMARPPTVDLVFNWLIAPPWERARARRLCRRVIAELIPEAGREPWKRSPSIEFDAFPEGSRLAKLVFPAWRNVVNALDREVVGRRALEQILAIKSWQIAHDGAYPDNLEALVPSELERLPVDPYSGKPFGLLRPTGRLFFPPIVDFNEFQTTHGMRSELRSSRPNQPVLYSVGPDKRDEGGHAVEPPRLQERGGKSTPSGPFVGDILFPIP